METVGRTRVRELPIVAGNLALDFANTIDDPEGPARHDHIADYAGLLAWADRVGVVDGAVGDRLLAAAARHPRLARQALGRAHELRRIVARTFGDVVAGQNPAPWEELRAFASDAVARATLLDGGAGYQLGWLADDDLGLPLRPVSVAALDLLTAPELARVKRCAGCPWLFLDQSKNASRRWCSMDDCGRHEKIRRYVTRRAARRTQARPETQAGSSSVIR